MKIKSWLFLGILLGGLCYFNACSKDDNFEHDEEEVNTTDNSAVSLSSLSGRYSVISYAVDSTYDDSKRGDIWIITSDSVSIACESMVKHRYTNDTLKITNLYFSVSKSSDTLTLAGNRLTIVLGATTETCGFEDITPPADTTKLVTSIALAETVSLLPNATKQLIWTIKPETAVNKAVTWLSSAPGIVTVDDNGLLTGIVPGTATVTATAVDSGGVSASCTVTVVDANAQPLITASQGWLESAYVTWTGPAAATSFNVYYSGMGVTDKKIDNQLIRSYGDYYRADVPGLAAGSYTIKVVPVFSGTEGSAPTSASVTVKPHDRSGYAFNGGRVPGAYKADGTPKDGAVILYITENTKNTVSLDVTGATTNPCVGLQNILTGYAKGKDTRPLIVRFVGQITDLSTMLNGDIVVENKQNASSYITLEGVGNDAVADGWGIRLKNASNIEIRNLGTMNCNSGEGDNIGLQQGNSYIWVHHCDFFYGHAGGDSDQAKGDGALDTKKSLYVTHSYNHFWDTGKSNLVGNKESITEQNYLTFHHNWYDHSDSRHPRVRVATVHVYNNYYDGVAKYGIGATMGASVFAEGNYFRNCKHPMLISMQGSDVWNASVSANDFANYPTFSSEDGGIIKAYNNYIDATSKRFVAYGSTTSDNVNTLVDFDAYVVNSRTETVPGTVTTSGRKKGGGDGGTKSTYNNFDTEPSMYSYTAETPEDAKQTVMTYAGRMEGGDFKWTFNNAVDDISYDVNAALKAALTSYKTKLVSIQGDGNGNGSSSDDGGGDDGSGGGTGGGINITGSVTCSFTASGGTNSAFTIVGNPSSSKGSVTVGGTTYGTCLKMESSTVITFTITNPMTLSLVFGGSTDASSKKVKVNGASQTTDASGILTMDLVAGTHTIEKGDSINLFYIALD